MRKFIWAVGIVVLAAVYEFVALSSDLWEWSEILFQISENKFALVSLVWFIGFTMGHALAPHVSRFRKKK
jgi:hypothetical protein